jgi:hypothetical protein
MPLAPYALMSEGGLANQKRWLFVEPVEMQLVHDHFVLTQLLKTSLTREEATALFDAIRPLVTARGAEFITPTPTLSHAYLSWHALEDIPSASPLRALGRSIDIWLPHTMSRWPAPWMSLQNDVQMAWFEHPISLARQARKESSVNSIWLHAAGIAQTVRCPFTQVLSNSAITRGLCLASLNRPMIDKAPSDFSEYIKHFLPQNAEVERDSKTSHTLIELDALTNAFCQNNTSAWRTAFAALERDWFAPALQTLQTGALPSLDLTLCSEINYQTFRITRTDLRKFWRRRTPAITTNSLHSSSFDF